MAILFGDMSQIFLTLNPLLTAKMLLAAQGNDENCSIVENWKFG